MVKSNGKLMVLVPMGSRAEMGLSAPILRKLGEDDFFEVSTFHLTPGNFEESYKITEQWITVIKPDIALIVADRIEMTAAAAACFMNRIPIAHYFAGIINSPLSTMDDLNRHAITLWSDIQFVESHSCGKVVQDLFNSIKSGLKANIHVVGITHLEGYNTGEDSLDYSLCPEEDFNLVLYNPITGYGKDENEEAMLKDVRDIIKICGKGRTIFIYPNEDPGHEQIFAEWNAAATIFENFTIFYHNLSRPKFLGLLKKCSKFISNSSAIVYEAPYFLDKKCIIKIGDRNKNRNSEFLGYEASTKIVEVLKEWRKL